MSQWNYQEVESHNANEVQLSDLDSQAVYAVRVVCRYADGRLGNLSDIVYSNRLEDGGDMFFLIFCIFVKKPKKNKVY